MRIAWSISVGVLCLALCASLAAFQRAPYQATGFEGDHPAGFPSDGNEKTEFVFARLKFPGLGGGFGRGFGGGNWWAIDYPKSDRALVQGIRRLTRVHVRSVEQVVDPDSDDLFNWPWMYAGQVSHWTFTPPQAARVREYLLRGGFLMIDDSHGDFEWQVVLAGLRMIFPNRPVEDLRPNDEIYHVLYDLDGTVQIPGTRFIWGGGRYPAGVAGHPKYRAIRDDRGRVMIAICHNTDVADAWEWADNPDYPERQASASFRLTTNYVIYGLTH
jgi:Domain of unknown function (DUF4159)